MQCSKTWQDDAADIAGILGLRLKSTGDAGEFTALVSTPDVDRDGDVMAPGCYTASIARMMARGTKLPILGAAHQWNQPDAIVGYADPADLHETADGLVLTGYIDLDSPMGKATWAAMKARTLDEYSVGFTIPAGGKSTKNGITTIHTCDLVEVSLAMRGVNPNTRTLSMKAVGLDALIKEHAHDRGLLAFWAGGAAVRGVTVFESPEYKAHGTQLLDVAGEALRELDATGPEPVRRAATKADALVYVARRAQELGVDPYEATRKVAVAPDARALDTAARAVVEMEDIANVAAKARAVSEEHAARAVRGRWAEEHDPGSTEMVGVSPNMTPVYAQRHDDIAAEAEAHLIGAVRARNATVLAQRAADERARARKAEELRALTPRAFGGTQ